jgi:hypothetical protein
VTQKIHLLFSGRSGCCARAFRLAKAAAPASSSSKEEDDVWMGLQ